MISVDEILQEWGRQKPDLNVAPMAVIGRLTRANLIVDAALNTNYSHWGLDGGSFDVIFTLARAGAPYTLTPSQLTERSMVTSAAVAQRLNRLVAAGFVTRSPNPDDARGTHVTLSVAGQHLVERALPTHVATEEALLRSLDEGERAQLAALLQKLLANHEKSSEPN